MSACDRVQIKFGDVLTTFDSLVATFGGRRVSAYGDGCNVLVLGFGSNLASFNSMITTFDGVQQNVNRPELDFSALQPFIPEVPVDMPFSADYPQC